MITSGKSRHSVRQRCCWTNFANSGTCSTANFACRRLGYREKKSTEGSGGALFRRIFNQYVRFAFFALEAIGSASLKALKVINRAYRLLPSESCPRCRKNQTAASNLLLGDRR